MQQQKVYYHGTDARIVRMSEVERLTLKNDCLTLIRFFVEQILAVTSMQAIKQLIKSGDISRRTLFFFRALGIIRNYQRLEVNSTTAVWLSDNAHSAKFDAMLAFSFSEESALAYNVLRLMDEYEAEFIDWQFDPKTADAIDRLLTFFEGNPEPVICLVDDVDEDLLVQETEHDFRYYGTLHYNASFMITFPTVMKQLEAEE